MSSPAHLCVGVLCVQACACVDEGESTCECVYVGAFRVFPSVCRTGRPEEDKREGNHSFYNYRHSSEKGQCLLIIQSS